MKFYKSGQGQALIWIHGFPFDHSIWNEIIHGLNSNYTVITVDLTGISNEALEHDISMSTMADEIKDYFDKENIKDAIFFGHSMGGYLAVEFLNKYPKMVKALSFIHSMANADDIDKKLHREKVISFLEKGEAEKMPFLKTMINGLFFDKNNNQHHIDRILDKCVSIPVKNIIALYKSIKNRQDNIITIKNAQIPIQWIIGDADTATPKDMMLSQSIVPNISLIHIIEECGHMSMFEHPKKLRCCIDELLDMLK